MTAQLVTLAPFASFIAVFLVVVALWPRPEAALLKKRVARFGPAALDSPATASLPFTHRVVFPSVDHVGGLLARLAPPNAIARVRERLERGGNPISLGAYFAIRALTAVVVPCLYLAAMVGTESQLRLPQLAVAAALAYVGYLLPNRWLATVVADRQRKIDQALPDALDLIVVSMQAGLGLDGAIAKVVEKTHGPLSDELRRVLHEIQLGEPRRESLRRIGPRTGVKDVITVFNALVQADQMGVSMVSVMEVQADEARLKRRQKAEEQAHQAGVKMTFPLILCILPSVFIVTVGPAALTIYQQLIVNMGHR